ncbi:MAG TPA: MFS transporter [Candidatus Lustribacter sp.]|nr:MFS transporter [Candidatus Lustribacter sp.]
MPRVVRSQIPFRLDRLPWSAWHWTVVLGLGITWVLDGLEVTIVGNIAPTLKSAAGLSLSDVQFTASASGYLVGAAAGALFFGYLTDKLGRKRLFLVTLGWYVALTAATAFSWNAESFLIFRILTGFGLGGEYAAINSAIDELIPAQRRGVVDLAINGTWWLGTILASLGSIVLLDPQLVDQRYGWRFAFGLGIVLAVAMLFVRRTVPESPRWLLTHGRSDEAERTVTAIEERIRASGAQLPAVSQSVDIDQDHRASLASVAHTMVVRYPARTAVALTLMCTQAFIYNAFTFTQGLILGTYFHVPDEAIPYYYLPFAIGNLAGPLLLGHFFDVVGRKAMIAATYILSGALLYGTGSLFAAGALNATTVTLCWMVVFFFASAGASAAYLTASEIFPMETRAMAIAIVYAIGTLVGGAYAPTFFGQLIATKSVPSIVFGYTIAAANMLAGGIVEAIFGVAAERKPLESVAQPLSAT